MYRVIWVVAFIATEHESLTRIVMQQSANTGQSRNVVSMSGQPRRHWANIETVLGDRQCLLGSAAAKYTYDPVLE